MAKPILSDLDFQNVSKITNLPNGSAPQEPVTVAQLDAAIEGVKSKEAARVSTQGNIDLSSPGAAIDGVTLSVGDRFLARAQTDPIENGVYIFNGAAVAATRALDFNSASEANNALVPIAEGSDAGVTFRQTTANPVIGTDPVVFILFGTVVPNASETIAGKIEIATQAEVDAGTDDLRAITPLKLATYAGLLRKFSASLGDGSATQFDLTHNLGTDDVQIEVYDNTSKESVIVDAKRQSSNVVRLNFNTAPTSNQFRCVVIG
jgi:hypothetical protein